MSRNAKSRGLHDAGLKNPIVPPVSFSGPRGRRSAVSAPRANRFIKAASPVVPNQLTAGDKRRACLRSKIRPPQGTVRWAHQMRKAIERLPVGTGLLHRAPADVDSCRGASHRLNPTLYRLHRRLRVPRVDRAARHGTKVSCGSLSRLQLSHHSSTSAQRSPSIESSNKRARARKIQQHTLVLQKPKKK